jgi:hypothetical protein
MEDHESNPQKQPSVVTFSIRLGLLKDAESSELFTRGRPGIRNGLAWIAEFSGTTAFGWFIVNLMADFGTRPSRPERFDHSDWSLQTQDFMVNILILSIIFTAQLFKFNFELVRDKNYKRKIMKGRLYYLPLLIATFLSGMLYLRYSQLPQVVYELFIPNPLIFSLFWISVSTLSFFGYKGLWTAILLAVLKGKKG